MQPPAHRPPTAWQIEHARIVRAESDLFFANLYLLLEHERDILSVDEYFFCRPSFAHYGVYFSRPLPLGALLLGWRHGIFMDRCCSTLGPPKSKVGYGSFVYFFGGMGSGVWWSGWCPNCANVSRKYDSTLIWQRMHFAAAVRDQFRDWTEVLEIEHYPTNKFSFGEPARVPCYAGRIREVRQPLINPVSVAELIDELKTDNIRPATAKDRTLLKEFLIIEQEGKEVERIRLLD